MGQAAFQRAVWEVDFRCASDPRDRLARALGAFVALSLDEALNGG
jgi:hypothetical protein